MGKKKPMILKNAANASEIMKKYKEEKDIYVTRHSGYVAKIKFN
jgi:hypothetical protein